MQLIGAATLVDARGGVVAAGGVLGLSPASGSSIHPLLDAAAGVGSQHARLVSLCAGRRLVVGGGCAPGRLEPRSSPPLLLAADGWAGPGVVGPAGESPAGEAKRGARFGWKLRASSTPSLVRLSPTAEVGSNASAHRPLRGAMGVPLPPPLLHLDSGSSHVAVPSDLGAQLEACAKEPCSIATSIAAPGSDAAGAADAAALRLVLPLSEGCGPAHAAEAAGASDVADADGDRGPSAGRPSGGEASVRAAVTAAGASDGAGGPGADRAELARRSVAPLLPSTADGDPAWLLGAPFFACYDVELAPPSGGGRGHVRLWPAAEPVPVA